MDGHGDLGQAEFADHRGAAIVACDACPVRCRIGRGRPGACGRFANHRGRLAHVNTAAITAKAVEDGDALVVFAKRDPDRETLLRPAPDYGRPEAPDGCYPEYKPAPFVVATPHDDVDTVTVVSEGMFTDCSVKVKIDTDRTLGAECSPVRADGTVVGHVSSPEYGAQMLSLGGIARLAPDDAHAPNVLATLARLCNREPVELTIDGGAGVVVQAGAAPVIDGVAAPRTRVACGSATVGLFARAWVDHVDEVVVVDEHITGVLSEHQAGRALGKTPSGLEVRGRRATPGRYVETVRPGTGWAGTDLDDPRDVIRAIDHRRAPPGTRLLITTPTGTAAFYGVVDDAARLRPAPMPPVLGRSLERIAENSEPAVCSVLFMAAAGRSLRAGVTEQPVLLSRAVHRGDARMTMGGAPIYVWPGGGLTIMVDVAALPRRAFTTLPEPALVAPVEFTLPRHLYAALGGHDGFVRPLDAAVAEQAARARLETLLLDSVLAAPPLRRCS